MALYDNPHFTIEPLAAGVVALLAKEGGEAIANAGLVDLGGEVLAYDCTLTPQAGRQLANVSQTLFGRKPGLVLLSHYHNDHLWGAQAFAGPGKARLLCSQTTAMQMKSDGAEEIAWYTANSATQLAKLRSEVSAAKRAGDEALVAQKSMWLGYYRGLVKAMPKLRVVAPTLTYNDGITLAGHTRTAEVLEVQQTHTGSDSILYLKAEGIAFVADLLFVGHHPYLADGNPDRLLAALKDLQEKDPRMVVGGHGGVGNAQDLALMIAYIEACQARAAQLRAAGLTSADAIAAEKPEARFAGWKLAHFYNANLAFLVKQAGG